MGNEEKTYLGDERIGSVKIDRESKYKLSGEICKLLVNTGLSFRQAEALLDYTKDRLKDAKISG